MEANLWRLSQRATVDQGNPKRITMVEGLVETIGNSTCQTSFLGLHIYFQRTRPPWSGPFLIFIPLLTHFMFESTEMINIWSSPSMECYFTPSCFDPGWKTHSPNLANSYHFSGSKASTLSRNLPSLCLSSKEPTPSSTIPGTHFQFCTHHAILERLSPVCLCRTFLAPWRWCVVHAKSLQSCPTLYNTMDHSPPGSSVHGIF